jgi:hypothetical protein
LVLVVLAIIWMAVLLPPALRRRAEGRPADSISAFRTQLAVLRRARPVPARSAVDRMHGQATMNRSGAAVTSLAAHRAQVAGGPPRPLNTRAFAAAGLPSPRSRALRRRRDVLVGLLVTAGVTLGLGLILGLPTMLLVHAAVDVLLVAYVALLIRQRTLAAEREMKVRFLPGPQAMPPTMLRRSVN